MTARFALLLFVVLISVGSTDAFAHPAGSISASAGPAKLRRQPPPRDAAPTHAIPSRRATSLLASDDSASSSNNDGGVEKAKDATAAAAACWNPSLRRTMGAISALGAAETAYLTYAKLFSSGGVSALCGASDSSAGAGAGECGSVLDGPFASVNLGGAEVPLSALGLAAYCAAAGLALFPLFKEGTALVGAGGAAAAEVVDESELDGPNRIALLVVTTAMATFSSFLMSILVGVLHASCPFCVASALLSVSLGVLSWSSGMIPPSSKTLGAQAAHVLSFGVSTLAALVLFFSVDEASLTSYSNDILAADGMTSNLVASTAKVQQQKDLPPPPITTKSSDRALRLASDLESLDARMFGAYWCSHCYEQKQKMGYEAMQRIPYIECAREGLNSQREFCNKRDVPGYPTWEIGGKLYPGEQELDELEDVVKEIVAKRRAANN